MNILLVYPEYPNTFWSFKNALKFISKKAAHPPLGLLTVAAMLPKEWNKKVVDLNVEPLKEEHLAWADYLFMSAMTVQSDSVQKVIEMCQNKKVKIVAGGPLFTASYEDFKGIDHFVLNEAEKTLPKFLEDLKNNCAQPIYSSSEFPELEKTPAPLWELIDLDKYSSMNIQYSRGCPFNCEFCDITTLFGRQVRTKNKDQVLAELEKLYLQGWRDEVFFVDDNFIGNKNKLKKEILPAITHWMKQHRYPFNFTTEASINLADDEELMQLMIEAGFNTVFIGLETPNEASLVECNKFQNKNRDLVGSVKKIQNFGFRVAGGFIVGFDHDSPSTFAQQVELIKKSRIVTAMVGLLNAPKNTPLYHRLKKENRLLNNFSGNNTDLSLNFIPKMDHHKLVEGYKKIIEELYSAKPYYNRVIEYLKNAREVRKKSFDLKIVHIKALVKSIFILGLKDKGRVYYWKLFFWSLFRRPKQFPKAITFAIYGYHFRKVFARYI